MKKKIMAVILSIAMGIAFMPAFSFAGETACTDNVDSQIAGYNQAVHDMVPIVLWIAHHELDKLTPEKIDEYCDQLDAYIIIVKKQMVAFHQDKKTKDAIDEFVAKAEEMQALLEKMKDLLNDHGYEANVAGLEQAYNDLLEAAQEMSVACLQGSIETLIEQIKSYEADGDVKAIIDAFVAQAEELNEIIAEYNDALPAMSEKARAQIDDMINETVELLQKEGDAIAEQIPALIEEQLENIQKYVESDEFDALLEKVGITKDELEALVIDVIAYASGYAEGNTYQGVVQDSEMIKDKTDELEAIVEDLKADIASLEASVVDYQTYVQQMKNGIKLMKTRTSIVKKYPKNTKAKTDRKVYVKWKNIKTCDVSKYQVYYKCSGKKAVYKIVNNAKAVNKYVTYKTGKLKKGKKYSFKVRGISYAKNPDTEKWEKFYGKWSYAKKVRVK